MATNNDVKSEFARIASLPFVELDVRHLEAPEPMKAVLQALQNLPAQSWLKVVHRREPFPLYQILSENGFRFHRQVIADGFQIAIWRISNNG